MISALPEIAAKYHADWLFKLDPDTTVYPSRLEAALNVLPPEVLYVGQVYSFEGRTYASGGAGYGIRGDVLQKFNTSQCELIPSESANYRTLLLVIVYTKMAQMCNNLMVCTATTFLLVQILRERH